MRTLEELIQPDDPGSIMIGDDVSEACSPSMASASEEMWKDADESPRLRLALHGFATS